MNSIGNNINRIPETIGTDRKAKSTPVKTTGDPTDTYDSFKGINLGIIKVGTFQDADKSETTEPILDKKGAAELKKLVDQTSSFKDVKVDPNAERITKTDSSEMFKGIVLFNRWKMGKFTTKKTVDEKTQYQVTGKIPIAGGEADMKTKMSQKKPTVMENRTWVSLFSR